MKNFAIPLRKLWRICIPAFESCEEFSTLPSKVVKNLRPSFESCEKFATHSNVVKNLWRSFESCEEFANPPFERCEEFASPHSNRVMNLRPPLWKVEESENKYFSNNSNTKITLIVLSRPRVIFFLQTSYLRMMVAINTIYSGPPYIHKAIYIPKR